MQQAFTNVEKMIAKKIIITPYLDPGMVDDIYHAMGRPPPGKGTAHNDGIDEDIKEDF